MLQKEPTPPVYCEHSFVMCKLPLRPEAATEADSGPSERTGLKGPQSRMRR